MKRTEIFEKFWRIFLRHFYEIYLSIGDYWTEQASVKQTWCENKTSLAVNIIDWTQYTKIYTHYKILILLYNIMLKSIT